MKINLKEDQYKGMHCILIENKRLCVKVIPGSGGKIQSIFDKKEHIEYLYQTSRDEYIRPRYDMNYDNGDISGFDDMFPTILPCDYLEYPWKGTAIPDHGEVWALPMQYYLGKDYIELSCYGVRLPYKFTKKLFFSDSNRLTLEYTVANKSVFDFCFIWAAHPLINIDESSEILLPKSVKKIFNTYGGIGEPSVFGKITDWGQEQCRIIKNLKEDMCKKFYVNEKMLNGECAIYNNRTGNYIKFNFPVDKVPYLGVWINWNGYVNKQKNVALEPCTGAFDSIDIAESYGKISKVSALNRYEWHMDIEIGKNHEKESVVH